MNLNPNDDHIMDYTTGWDNNCEIGNTTTALLLDYLSQKVWNMPVNKIAIVRHQKVGEIKLDVFDNKDYFSIKHFVKYPFM